MAEGDHGPRPLGPEAGGQLRAGVEQGEGLAGTAQFVHSDPRREERTECASSAQDGADDIHPPFRQPVGQVDDDALDAPDLEVGAEKDDLLRARRAHSGPLHVQPSLAPASRAAEKFLRQPASAPVRSFYCTG